MAELLTISPIDQKYTKKPKRLLQQAGYDTQKDIEGLKGSYQEALQMQIDPMESVKGRLWHIRGNVIGYTGEYIWQDPIVANLIYKKEYQGKPHVFNLYSEAPLNVGILKEERLGAVAEVLDKVEPILSQEVKPGSPSKVMVMVSPEGQSGMRDPKGNLIKYPDTEIFMWRIGSNGELSSYTLIVDDFKAEKCKELLIGLGVLEEKLKQEGSEELEYLSNIVRNFATVEDADFDKIVRKVQEIKGSEIVRYSKYPDRIVARTFDEVYQEFENGKLMKRAQKCETLLRGFDNYILENMHSLNSLSFCYQAEQMLEETILDAITLYISGKKVDKNIPIETMFSQAERMNAFNFMRRYVGGCNGGGIGVENGLVMLNGPQGFRGGVVESGSNITCKSCRKLNTCNKLGEKCYSCKAILIM